MNVFIVYAHPEEASFCAALKNQAVDILSGQGHTIVVSDLYAMNFNPVLNRGDFLGAKDKDFFKPQLEQVHASHNNSFAADISAEQERLLDADMVLFYFPVWWFSFPAIMKGWVDRVGAMNVAYGGDKGLYASGPFQDKKGMLVVTTGGDTSAYEPTGRNGSLDRNLYHIQHGVLAFWGMQVLEPFAAHAPVRLSPSERSAILAKHAKALSNLHTRPHVQFDK